MKDIYAYLTVEDVHKDEKAIIEVLKGIHSNRLKNDLRVLNYFKEIPVSYGATIPHIDEDFVELHVHQHQAAVMHVEKTAFLKSEHFQHDVIAKVYKSNISKSVGLLHNFSYAQIRAERRRFVRVQIFDNIRVDFRHQDLTFSGRLADISIGGVSIESADEIQIELEKAGILTVGFPGAPLEIPGRLLKITPIDVGFNYVFEMEAGSKIESVISQFIFQKQVEIIRELKEQLVHG